MKNSDKSGYSDNARYQLKKFGYNMVALSLSIALYYLGFFGTVEGPLNPCTMAQNLKSFGFSGHHLLSVLLVLFLLSLTWNWIYNSVMKLRFSFKNTKVGKAEEITGAPKMLKKGKWGHTLWVAMLIIILTFAFHMFKN